MTIPQTKAFMKSLLHLNLDIGKDDLYVPRPGFGGMLLQHEGYLSVENADYENMP